MSATRKTPKKGKTPRGWQSRFIASFSESGNVRAACEVAGVSRATAYRHRKDVASFREAWSQAEEEAVERLEETARKRAVDGSDTLLIFLLKAHRPEKYRERYEAIVRNGDKDIDVEIERLAQELEERARGGPIPTE